MIFNVLKLNRDLETALAETGRLVSALATKETEFEEAKKLAAELTESNVALGKQIEALNEEINLAKSSANAQAAQTLASLGVPEGTIKETVTAPVELSVEALDAEYRKLKASNPALASDFYRANRDKFLKIFKR